MKEHIVYYNSFSLTRKMTERRITKLKTELTELKTYMAANANEENKPALVRIHANVTGQLNALENCGFQKSK